MLPPFPPPPPPPGLGHDPAISIVITNRDYAAYLPAAIGSALGQREARVEVLVVDDGSTDDSREIIASYGDGVRTLLLDGAGQKAAFNAALEVVTGDVVLFLDADDALYPGTAAAVAAAFADHPGAARAVFRLDVVDGDGRSSGACVPPAAKPLPHGDVRQEVLTHPDDLPWPPTSGNAFAAWALRRVLPMPDDGHRTGADMWLHPLIPLLGPVVALDEPGGLYRLHGANEHGRAQLDVERSRVILRRARIAHGALHTLARELGLGPATPRSITIAVHRLLSLRLAGAGHPVAGDTLRRALGAGLRAAHARRDVGRARRAAYAGWFCSPRSRRRPPCGCSPTPRCSRCGRVRCAGDCGGHEAPRRAPAPRQRDLPGKRPARRDARGARGAARPVARALRAGDPG